MPSTRPSRSLALALLLCAAGSVPFHAETPRPAPGDGTVQGALTVNGEKFDLTHIYGRKREAWPADAQLLGADDVDELSCGVVELVLTNEPLSDATLAGILESEYKGSETIRGLRIVIDGAGTYKWETQFLLEEGAVKGWGITQSSGSITTGRRYTGQLASSNQQVNQVRTYDVSFDTAVKVQYSRTETETAKPVPGDRLAAAFLETLPGEWTIERWLGLGCTTATGTLVVGERASPRAFQGMFHITTSNGDEIEEDVTISIAGNKVHLEGGKVSVPESIWIRDVLDLELWEGLLIGGNGTSDFVVLRKN